MDSKESTGYFDKNNKEIFVGELIKYTRNIFENGKISIFINVGVVTKLTMRAERADGYCLEWKDKKDKNKSWYRHFVSIFQKEIEHATTLDVILYA